MGVPDFIKEFYDNMKLNPWSSFLTVVIFAPLFEELLCRGVILRGLLHHITPAKAIFWSALMFAVMHLNPWQALPAFMVGLLMGGYTGKQDHYSPPFLYILLIMDSLL